MATTTTNFGWDIPQSTDLVKDGATAIAALGQDIDTALIDLKGGTTGQILSKASGTDLDYTWITNDVGDITAVTAGTGISGGGTTGAVTITNLMATAIDAKGDLVAGTGADAFSRLAVGTNGQVLTADSTAATGLAWATNGASGLTLIKKQTIGTAVNSVAVTSAFSSTYENYKIIITGGTASGNNAINLKFGSSTTGYYHVLVYTDYVNTAKALGTTTGDSFKWAANATTNVIRGNIDINAPFLAQNTGYFAQWMSPSESGMSSGFHNVATSYTDFTIQAESGTTMTGGNIYVYGYRKDV
jgi:hypothetical protein